MGWMGWIGQEADAWAAALAIRPASCPSRPSSPSCHMLGCTPDMDDTTLQPVEEPQIEPPKIPAEPLPPIESRFLFVDVAALRAKQLRRGARPRLEDEVPLPHKAERVAMEEVRRGLVYYDVPPKPSGAGGGGMSATAADRHWHAAGAGVEHGVRAGAVHRLLRRLRVHEDEEDSRRDAVVVKSLDERITPPADGLLAPTAPRGPADQLKSPELLEAAARKILKTGRPSACRWRLRGVLPAHAAVSPVLLPPVRAHLPALPDPLSAVHHPAADPKAAVALCRAADRDRDRRSSAW